MALVVEPLTVSVELGSNVHVLPELSIFIKVHSRPCVKELNVNKKLDAAILVEIVTLPPVASHKIVLSATVKV